MNERKDGQAGIISLPAGLSHPARSALATAGLDDLTAVAAAGELAVAGLHGMGPKGIRILKEAMHAAGLAFNPDPCQRMTDGQAI